MQQVLAVYSHGLSMRLRQFLKNNPSVAAPSRGIYCPFLLVSKQQTVSSLFPSAVLSRWQVRSDSLARWGVTLASMNNIDLLLFIPMLLVDYKMFYRIC